MTQEGDYLKKGTSGHDLEHGSYLSRETPLIRGSDLILCRPARGPAAPIPKPKILIGDDQDGQREVVAAARHRGEHRKGGPHLPLRR